MDNKELKLKKCREYNRKHYHKNIEESRKLKKISGAIYRATTRGKLNIVFNDMKRRCYNKSFKHYKNYGGRGIAICKTWLNSKDSFFKWALSNGFKHNLEIDRTNNDRNYKPSNCRWITHKENCRNTRKSVTDFINETRICRVCKINKKLTEFNKDNSQTLSRRYMCRECQKNYANNRI